MAELTVLYRDVDRAPYLYTLRHCARSYDLDVELRRVASAVPMTGAAGADWGRLLERGEVDVIAENYWGLMTYAARGVPFLTVASTAHRWRELLLVRPGVGRVEDLAGRRFAVRDTGPQALFPGLWLEDAGLAGEVEQVVVPQRETGRWGHWKRVAEGECDACFMSPLYAAPALAAGLTPIPHPGYDFEGGHVTLTTTERVVAERRPAVQALVDAAFDANELFRDERATALAIAERDCADLLGEHFDLSSSPVAELYDLLREEIAPDPVPTPAGIGTAHRLRSRTAPELAGYNPLLMWDLSFARAARRDRATRQAQFVAEEALW
ncbi:ABC transporter substrate-binding protein [Phytohabitans kaempferiae]|uniref:ABC transporter substrate-binding protein n=1 Tax=Phytohabitans kaempferiae TaxID=1620943 RepID=A0ABV6LZF1_9ACTN